MNVKSALSSLPAPAKYFPVHSEGYSTRAGLKKIDHNFGNGTQDNKLFQLDADFLDYHNNKLAAREMSYLDYVCTETATTEQLLQVTQFIQQHLCAEHPDYFSQQDAQLACKLTGQTFSLQDEQRFDKLALQVQEDICVMQNSNTESTLIAAHLCAANHWSAREKLGLAMHALHQHVPGFLDENRQPDQLLTGLQKNQQAYVRFAWGITPSPTLNRHPGFKKPEATLKNNKIWLRVERQVLLPIPDSQLMLFTIRTYFTDSNTLDTQQRHTLIKAIHSMNNATLHYKNINKDDVLKILTQQN